MLRLKLGELHILLYICSLYSFAFYYLPSSLLIAMIVCVECMFLAFIVFFLFHVCGLLWFERKEF